MAAPPTPEDWRILRALSLYRLLLDMLLLVLLGTEAGSTLFATAAPARFYSVCVAYALAALVLLLPVLSRRPPIRVQAPIHFIVDTLAITAMVNAAGGAASGLGMLLVTPAVSCSLVQTRRMALMHAVLATATLLASELLRLRGASSTPDMSAVAVLGTILIGSSFAANTVAQRARDSEALAARVGVDLAQLSRLNERIIANLQTGVLLLDPERRLRVLNAAARRLLGLGDARPGQSLRQLFPALVEALDVWQLNPSREPAPLLAPTGRHELIVRPMRLGPAGDMSTLVLLDEAARVREQAQQMKLAALARLSASIAHEIRNPLSAIHHAGQLLAESETLNEQERRLVGMIDRHSTRIERIVRNVLSLSRREETVPVRLELGSWLRAAIEQYEEGAPARRGLVQLHELPEAAPVRFDAGHLQRILFNLWDNSFDHGGRQAEDTRVSLYIGLVGETRQVFLDIRDNGRGIPAPLLDRVFEPFFSTAHEGTGLGLYLARELCDQNQSRLEYRPLADGACFRIIFAAGGEA